MGFEWLKRWLLHAKWFLLVAAGGFLFTRFYFPVVAKPIFISRYPVVQKKVGFFSGLFGETPKEGPPRWQIELTAWTKYLYIACGVILLLGLLVAFLRTRRTPKQSAGLPDASHLDPAETQNTTPGGTLMIPGENRVTPSERYELRRMLGKGGMGEVHEAFDTSLDRVVALKKLPTHLASNIQLFQRFTQEAKALAKVSHPHVVQVYDILSEPGGCYISLEYVPGGDLHQLIEKEGRLSPGLTLTLARKMAEGLAFAHEQGIVHRDIKPRNFLLTKDLQPKLTDFGIAKIESSIQLTVDGAIMGTPAYMSPEQAAGKVADSRSDVYSFGIMMFQMLEGRTPYEGDTRQVLAAHLTQRVPNLNGIPAGLNAIIQKATDPNLENRYPSGAELAEALRSVI